MNRHWSSRRARIFPIALAIAALLGLVLMALWNALIPDLFHGPVINYWQALGLFILSRLLFFSGGPGRFGRWRHEDMRRKLEERWAMMNPEQREKLRRRMGHGPDWEPRDWKDDKGTAEAGAA